MQYEIIISLSILYRFCNLHISATVSMGPKTGGLSVCGSIHSFSVFTTSGRLLWNVALKAIFMTSLNFHQVRITLQLTLRSILRNSQTHFSSFHEICCGYLWMNPAPFFFFSATIWTKYRVEVKVSGPCWSDQNVKCCAQDQETGHIIGAHLLSLFDAVIICICLSAPSFWKRKWRHAVGICWFSG